MDERPRSGWFRSLGDNPVAWVVAGAGFLFFALRVPPDDGEGSAYVLGGIVGGYLAVLALALAIWAVAWLAFLRRSGFPFVSPLVLVLAMAFGLMGRAANVGREVEARQQAHAVLGAQYSKESDVIRGCVAGGMQDYERETTSSPDFPYTKKQWGVIITRYCHKADAAGLANGKPVPRATMKRLLVASIHELHEEGKLPPSAPDPAAEPDA